MDSSELLTLFRTEVGDTVSPYLWSDDEVLSFEDDAQTMFCRKTDGISDTSTTDVTRLAVTSGSDTVALHRTIKRIRSARRTDTGRSIEVINEEDMPERGWFFDGRPGQVRALVIGAEELSARIWPMPNETITVQLTVFRLPLVTINDGDMTLEVDAQHHRHLLLWVKHLAYGKHDAETFDKRKSDEFKQMFLDYCAEVQTEQRRRRHKPRSIAYGGI